MNAKKAKAIRKFMRVNMGLNPAEYKSLYKDIKKKGDNRFAHPKDNWRVGEDCEYRFADGQKKRLKIARINGYNKLTGELHLTLRDSETGAELNSAYDKDRFKI